MASIQEIIAKKKAAQAAKEAAEKEAFDQLPQAHWVKTLTGEIPAPKAEKPIEKTSAPVILEPLAAKIAAIKSDTALPKRSLKEILEAKKLKAESLAFTAEPSQSVSSASKDELADTAEVFKEEQKEVPKAIQQAFPSAVASQTFSLSIDLNEDQILASDLALAGQSYCLIGAAGTGKTTTQRSVAKTLWKSGKLSTSQFKLQGGGGTKVTAPSIAFIAYTRRASANLQRAIHRDPELKEVFEFNVMTAHALLEFQPVFYYDEVKQKETMRFLPTRDASNPLDITHLVIEEASMIGLDLWEMIFDALPERVQIIFIGDINQLPPVFGPSILNYALASLPVVELKKVYRQQDGSAILDNAHKILKGDTRLDWGRQDFQAIEGKEPVEVGAQKLSAVMPKLFKALWKLEGYDPETDMILAPFNVGELGTDVLNKYIAQFLGEARGAVVWEVLAGWEKHYLAVGDRCMFQRRDAIIESIVRNGSYMGKAPQKESADLTRFGMRSFKGIEPEELDQHLEGYENFSLEALEQEDRKQQASHIIKVRLVDSGELVEITSAGDLNGQSFQLAYALTVHKAQGCEWKRVFLILHKCHAVMTYRELFYTAVTRSREQFIMIGKKPRAEKAIESPRIKGNTLQDKIDFFNANMDLSRQVQLVK